MLSFLTDFFEKERSAVIKDVLAEKYKDIQDMKSIKTFEKEEK
jgi:hypothetical protein